jgi:hypothetical protein
VVTHQKEGETKITKMRDEFKNREFGQEDWGHLKLGKNKGGAIMGPSSSGNLGSGNSKRSLIGGYYGEIQNMTEIEARKELTEMWTEMRTLRVFWKTKEMLTKDKYEREIFVLKK